MKSFLLKNHDLTIDAAGNLAFTATENERIAQDVTTAILFWLKDSFFDVNAGIPYSAELFGTMPIPFQLLQNDIEQACLAVVGVNQAILIYSGLEKKHLTGFILINQDLRVVLWL
jgi:hypothetical protein